MSVLSSGLRRMLESACTAGRVAAEAASRAALVSLAVTADRPPAHLSEEDRRLRRGLRAKARQLGDTGDSVELLVADCAYEQWHRLLFARFLAENNLLIHPDFKAPVTLADCDELAEELSEPDGWSVAARFASQILPGIFRLDDPCVQVRLAPEGRLALEKIVADLPADVFAADDALGWVYQFWQKQKKDEVNASERKIGGADLGPVTQLFTENYMVRFLLENSLGAWWAARRSDSPLIKEWEYLRFDDDGAPAAGSFDGWPDVIDEVTVMDPCCGSGHFLVEAFKMLWRMRVEENGLDPVAAQDAVLRDNLFGLELDPRCVQIAMFAVALHAWKDGGGWRELPVPNIACSGIPVKAPVDEWKRIAPDERLENALVRLHILFRDADTLGSLINPKRTVEITDSTGLQTSSDDVDWHVVAPLLAKASNREEGDPASRVLDVHAMGIARAADYLSRRYTLVTTNVPFLSRKAHGATLGSYVDRRFPEGKTDLATAMIERCWELAGDNFSVAVVSPVQWLFLRSYRDFRHRLLSERNPHVIVRLGPRAFSGISGEIASVSLMIGSKAISRQGSFAHLDLTSGKSPEAKRASLNEEPLCRLETAAQRDNPNSVISEAYEGTTSLLADFADGYAGIQTGDLPRFVRMFWELPEIDGVKWRYYQGTVRSTREWGGLEKVLLWEDGRGSLHQFVSDRLGGNVGAWIRGTHCAGRRGVSVSQMGSLPVALYAGELFDPSSAVILPKDQADVPAIWHFCRSSEYAELVREIDQSLKVTNSTLVKVPFDILRWRQKAEEEGPLPPSVSDDPTQWVFAGSPRDSDDPLQVAVGRLLGYSWPGSEDADAVGGIVDNDGIVCFPSVVGESPASDRLQAVLEVAFGASWTPSLLMEILKGAGSSAKSLAEWLDRDFFKSHCSQFQDRPFIWQVWDGRKDGFSALLNYHRLDRANLERLTYTYLGDWIERQTAGVRDDVAEAEDRLAAAKALQRRLELILEGEPPYDTYVRWKELHQQPIGWDPDLNDGVRLNIRPFVEAGILRSKFNIHWKKDRGKNPDGSERHNDLHYTNAEKLAARKEAGQ